MIGLKVKFINPLKGRGVFATKTLKRGTLLEECEVIVIPSEQYSLIENTIFFNYLFPWSDDGRMALGLGYGSLYNHSSLPNAIFVKDFVSHKIQVRAICDIHRDQEVCIDYTALGTGSKPLRFKEL